MLESGKNWQYNAGVKVNPNGQPEWAGYIWGYKLAADRLAISIAKDRHGIDVLIYPLCFLYRHYLELVFKRIIMVGSALHDMNLHKKKSHNLEGLFVDVSVVLKAEFGDAVQEELAVIQDAVKAIHSVDKRSDSFRYPVENDGNDIGFGTSHINVEVLYDKMQELERILEPMLEVLGIKLDAKWEYLSECSGE